MYPGPRGHGDLAWNMLQSVRTKEDFDTKVRFFNEYSLRYTIAPGEAVQDYPLETLRGSLNFRDSYFRPVGVFCWESDWIFIKNASKQAYVFTLTDGRPYELRPGRAIRLHFGAFEQY
jgi:hypothetical protein